MQRHKDEKAPDIFGAMKFINGAKVEITSKTGEARFRLQRSIICHVQKLELHPEGYGDVSEELKTSKD